MPLDIVQAAKDYWGRNDYALKAFTLRKKAPFAIVCPGGGYAMTASFVEGKPYAKALNKLGYAAFVLRYRTKEKARYPAPMEDLAQAVHYILEHADALNVEKEGWSLWGASAGGHLAASFGTHNMGYKQYGLPAPAALVLCYPVVTMGALTHPGSLGNLLGPDAPPHLRDEVSVEKQIDGDYPPTFLWCSKTDETVDWRNSKMLADELARHGVAHKFLLFNTGRHGAGLAKDTEAEVWFSEAVRFWQDARQKYLGWFFTQQGQCGLL